MDEYIGDSFCDDPKHQEAEDALTESCFGEFYQEDKTRQMYLCNLTYDRCMDGEVYMPYDANGMGGATSGIQEMTQLEFDDLVAKQCMEDLETCQRDYGELGTSEETPKKASSSSTKFARAVGYADGDIYIAQASNRPRNPKTAISNEDGSGSMPFAYPNLNCAAHQFDAGDCKPKDETSICNWLYSCMDEKGVDGIYDCNFAVCLPQQMMKSKIGDGHCDISFGDSKVDLVCSRFRYDGNDCVRSASSISTTTTTAAPTTAPTTAPTSTTTTTTVATTIAKTSTTTTTASMTPATMKTPAQASGSVRFLEPVFLFVAAACIFGTLVVV